MPLTVVVDKQRRLVISTASGTLSYSDIVAHQELLTKHPDFDPSFDQLFDGTGVKDIALSAEEIQAVARQRIFAAGSRQAFATSSDFAYGMARMFEIYRETSGTGRLMRVFDSLEAAQAWLQPSRVRREA